MSETPTDPDPRFAAALGTAPSAWVRPDTVAAVQAAVAEAAAAGHSVVPWGGGCGQDYGYPPRTADRLLDLSGLNRVIAHEYADMTITVEAGITLAALQAQLATRGQFLPLDPPHPDRATIGGIVAADASGPLRLGYGRCRDWLIGIQVVDGAGRLVHGGGKVVKNVTGYDLPKLYCGSLGTLGVIVEATFKVAPRPEAVRTVVVRAEGDGLGAFLADLRLETDPVQMLVHEDPEAGRFAVALYHGAEEAVEAAAQVAVEIARRHAAGAVGVYPEDLTPQLPDAAIEVRLGGAAVSALALHDAVAGEVAGSGATLLTRWGVGDVWAMWPADDDAARAATRRLLALARLRDHRFTLVHGPLDLRADGLPDLWLPEPGSLALQRRLKETLDPTATLNPGRFVGRI